MDYKKFLGKPQIKAELYDPIIDLFEKENKPLSIKEVASILNFSYSVAKQRLHKLAWNDILIMLKRGYYCLPRLSSSYTKISKPKGKLVFLNSCIRIMGSSKGVWITIYNSKFGEVNNGKFCIVKFIGDDKFIIRKTNDFHGSKIYLLTSKSVGISVSRKRLPEEITSKLSTKVIPIKIGVYLEEWKISVRDLFSTESKEDGELAEELSKIGEVDKQNKFKSLKADILFSKKGMTIPIEITIGKPSDISKRDQGRKSSIKSSQIMLRLYYSIKWNLLRGLPTILIIHKDWEQYEWVSKEQEFMKRFNCYVIFTNFKENWAKKVAQEIKRLTESSRFNKTTQLGSKSSSN
jgi:hypothetical protein